MQHEKRFGRFRIDRQVIHENADIVMQLMGSLIVVRAEMLAAQNAIEYVAFGPMFDEVPDYADPPMYNIEVETTETETKFDWKMV